MHERFIGEREEKGEEGEMFDPVWIKTKKYLAFNWHVHSLKSFSAQY
jgi:hypothetical protein